jgi:hypothetical protein
MLIKGQLLSATNLNNAFISKTDTNSQTLASNLTISGGALTLKNSVITDNASSSYLRIDPQGNQVIIYDGVNNQRLDVFSSSGSESTYIQTINGTKSFGQIDVASAVDHLEIATNSSKPTIYGGDITVSGNGRTLRLKGSTVNQDNISAIVFDEGDGSDHFRLQFDGLGGSGGGRLVLNPLGVTGLTYDRTGNLGVKNTSPVFEVDVVGSVQATNWLRAKGNTGFYFQDWGGGFYMTDATWIRTYNNKSFYQNSGTMRTDGTFQIGNNGATLNVPSGGQFNYMSGKFAIDIDGTVTSTGPINITSNGQGKGISIAGVTNIDSVGVDGSIAIRGLKQLRFGDSTSWDWNVWGGIKFDSTNMKMYIGGPASSQFSSNASPATIDVAFSGIGKLGVGTDSPVEMLDVNGNIKLPTGRSLWVGNNADSGARTRIHNNGTDAYIDFGTGNLYIRNTVPTTVMTILSGGNVGVGTSSPLQKLDVNSSARFSGNIYGGNSSGYMGFLTDAGGALPIKASSLALTSSYSNTAPTYGLYVQGSAGVGTATPSGRFHVVDTGIQYYTSGDTLALKKVGGGQYPYISFYDTGGVRGGYFGWGVAGSRIDLTLENGNNLYINGGNVGIGNSAPAYALDVSGDIKATGTLVTTKTGGDIIQATGGTGLKTIRYDNGNLRFWNPIGLEVMTLNSGNRVGINQSNPAYTLDVTGDINATGVIYSPGTNAKLFQVGNSSALWDVGVANTLGVYGVSNTAIGAIKLGSTGPTLYGTGNTLGIGTTSPWTGVMLDLTGSIRVGSNNGLYSAYSNSYMIKDHGNGNVTVNASDATSGNLYLGYVNTSAVRLSSKMVGTNGTTNILGTDGTLYYKGTDTDSRYLNLTGGTITSDLSVNGNLTTNGSNTFNGTSNTFANKVLISNGDDVSMSGNGFLQLGATSGWNMVIDQNEIQVRNNGVANLNLNLQPEGGDTTLGGNLTFLLDNAIYASGVRSIDFFGPASSGIGMAIGAGGMMIIGSGESAQTFKTGILAEKDASGNAIYNGGSESTYVTSDNSVFINPGQNTAYNRTFNWEFSSAGNIWFPNTTGIYMNQYGNIYQQTAGSTGYWGVLDNGGTQLLKVDWGGTGITVKGGIYVTSVTDIDGTNNNGLTLKDSSNGKFQIDSNEAWVTDSSNTRISFTWHMADMWLNHGAGSKRVPRVSYGTSAPTTTNAYEGDIYVQY